MNKILNDIKYEYSIGGIVNKLIYWNIVVFLLSLVFFNFRLGYFQFPDWIALNSNPQISIKYFWTLITYGFFHNSFWHLFFNMVVLNFYGRLFLTFFNQKQLLGLYFLSTIFSGLVFISGFYLLNLYGSLVGASAGIMAILVATTSYSPLMKIRLMLFGTIKLWHLTAVLLLLDIMNVFIENTGGHIAHLAGAFFGFLFIQLLKNGTDTSRVVTNFIDFATNLFQPKEKKPFKKVHTNYNITSEKSVSSLKNKDKVQQQIDEILDKISKSGYDSLSADEKDFLFKAGK